MDPATAVKPNLHSIFLEWYQSVTEWNQMQRNGMFKAELDRVSQWLMEVDISDTHGNPVQCNVLRYPTQFLDQLNSIAIEYLWYPWQAFAMQCTTISNFTSLSLGLP